MVVKDSCAAAAAVDEKLLKDVPCAICHCLCWPFISNWWILVSSRCADNDQSCVESLLKLLAEVLQDK